MITKTEIEDLSQHDYERIRRLVYEQSGINLGGQKMQLVRSRLGKRVRQGGFKSFRDYCRHVESDATGQELCRLLDAISTNTTHLFREMAHFEFLRAQIARWVAEHNWCENNATLRIWSAACSSGEEPYSIAMTAYDALPQNSRTELKILATDLSTRMLARAERGTFEAHRVGTVPAPLRNRYLTPVIQDGSHRMQVVPQLRRTITFARFNLMAPTFPFRHGFHAIFCRNVMIYFDRPTQEQLVQKLTRHLRKGGFLIIGHSESLNGIEHRLSYVQPTIYRKDDDESGAP